mmetsp:Transcript_1560/g.6940  ORF Transcript_1560/g.6940 Transcript_1560/m.6940 type:complete len:216 (-) Transcript_1560:782-1429(-)
MSFECKVALNSSTCSRLNPRPLLGILSKSLRMASLLPESSSLSASSSTKNRTPLTSNLPDSTMSMIRPGVPVATSHPAFNALTSLETSVPPTKSPHWIAGSPRWRLNERKNSCVCSARSRAGSNTIAFGVRTRLSVSSSSVVTALSEFEDPTRNSPGPAADTPLYPPGGGSNRHGAAPKFTEHSAFFRHSAGNSACRFSRFGISNAAPTSSPLIW